MAVEHTRIVAIEPDHIWVEMVQQSTCQACSARKGCGQGSIADVIGGKRSRLKVPVSDEQYRSLAIGQWIDIAVEDSAIILGSLWVYLMPLVFIVILALIGGSLLPAAGAPIGGVAGFVISIVVIRWQSAAPGRLEFLNPKPYIVSKIHAPQCYTPGMDPEPQE